MPSLAGTRLGNYEIVALVGRGGMGEVYRARDVRLGRDVALKVITEDGSGDPARRQRIDREARALASLNHPNIASIHGIEETQSGPASSATTAIVMEYVEGETLAERLRHGALPLDEALRLAAQIADALDEAHQRGIVHRDLKPANIKITSSGTAKVLDFGLAKMLADPSHAEPTVTNLTATAAIIGTASYMAPEQAQGKPVDTRADIWAFGVVVYEMVTGTRLFQGESFHSTLAAVLSAEPNLTGVPAPVQRLLQACLERDVAKRLRDIGDVRFLLAAPAPVPEPATRRPRSMPVLAGVAIGLLAFVAGTLVVRNTSPPPRSPLRLSTVLPEGVNVTRGPGYTSSVAVSPDGRTVVIAATDARGQRLYRRSVDRVDAVSIDGTDGATSPFFSWEGDWIGFFAHGRLKRIPAAGGASVDIADVPVFSSGASWGPDDRIVFAYGADARLLVVPAAGGPVKTLLADRVGRQPEVLPGGRRVLFESAGKICVLDLDSGSVTVLIDGTAPRYTDGQVVFSRSSTLLAAPFDPDGTSVGTAVPLVDGVAVELPGSGGGRHYAVARTGALVYVPAPQAYELALLDPGGDSRALGGPQRSFENPRFSPDGTEVVVGVRRRDDEPTDLWLHDLTSGASTRLTTNGGRAPVWNGDRLVTYSHLGENQGIYTVPADGGAPRKVVARDAFHWLVGWTPDRTLVFGEMQENQLSSILTFRDGTVTSVVGPGSTWGGRLSRDGKWLAYYVLESGRFEIYVSPLGASGTRWLVGEGTDPAWAPDGTELYYRSGPRLMAAHLDKSSGVRVAATRVVVDPFLPPLYDDYDIHPNGKTVVIVRPVHATYGREVAMAFDWTSELPSARER